MWTREEKKKWLRKQNEAKKNNENKELLFTINGNEFNHPLQ